MDEGKRKELFVKFQTHMYDNAVAMKAGNYGIFQVATAKLKNFTPYRIPRMWGVTGSSRDRATGGGGLSPDPSNGDRMLSFLAAAPGGRIPGAASSSRSSPSGSSGSSRAIRPRSSSTPAPRPEQVARLRAQLGLDKPLPLQMVEWYGRILRGDLGQSILLNRSVAAALLERLPVTLSLAGIALVFAVVLGVAAGIVAAVNHNRWPDQAVMARGAARPVGAGILARSRAGVRVRGEARAVADRRLRADHREPTGWARSIALPALTLGLVQIGFIARMARASMLEVLGQDFIRTADAKGLSRADIVIRHGLPNALCRS